MKTMWVNNPFGDDIADIISNSENDRIGKRIRTIRTARGLSQSELGDKIGLGANRIQQYECGARKPKMPLLKKIARALGVETLALLDPVALGDLGAMYVLFTMEDPFGLQLKEDNGEYYIQFTSDNLNRCLREWYQKRRSVELQLENASADDREKILNDYNFWEWSYPRALADKSARHIEKIRIQAKIKELQEALRRLEEN